MKKTVSLIALAVAATVSSAAFAQDQAAPIASTGKMLYAVGGKRLAPVYRVSPDGSPQIILDGKLITVPAASLSVTDGKVMTSKSKTDLVAAR